MNLNVGNKKAISESFIKTEDAEKIVDRYERKTNEIILEMQKVLAQTQTKVDDYAYSQILDKIKKYT
jgi:hypothetical protein